MSLIRTAQWKLDGEPVFGPDSVSYAQTPVIGARLDGLAQRQGGIAMEWHYQHLPIAELQKIMEIWERTYPQIAVRWFTPAGTWQDTVWSMLQPAISRRMAFYAEGISIRFVPVVYTGSGLSTAMGETPVIYPGFDVPNPPPVARISYSAAIIGDPQIVVNVSGTGSTDADGMVMTYTWIDNAAAFSSMVGYPQFESAHEFTTPTATFVYEYMAGMPDPVITLTVADNAGQTGTASITVNIADLIAALPTRGIRIVIAAGGSAYVSFDGGLTFLPVANVSGVTAVAGAGGFIIIGCDNGDIYRAPNEAVTTAKLAYTMASAVASLSVSAVAPSSVIAIAVDGSVAYSSSSGQVFVNTSSPLGGGNTATWNQDVSNEMSVAGN